MDGTSIRVLVVDDEADFRNLMTFWLESKGCKVITAPDGKSAIELVKQQNVTRGKGLHYQPFSS